MLEIATMGNGILTQKALRVEKIDASVASFIADMFESMRAHRGLGLAAPQVGRSERMFIASIDGDGPRAFINPEIVFTSPEEVVLEEGCLSIPGLYKKVRRPEFVKVQAWNERGRRFNLEAEGLLARVILHEFDHLNGILFVDRLLPAAKRRALEEYEKKLRI